FQDSPDDEEDTRSSHEYLNDIEEEYQARALLDKFKRLFKKDDNEMVEVRVLMALAEENDVVSKEGAINVNDTKVTIPGVERPWLSEGEGFILPNHDTGRILPANSQRNTTDPSVAVIDSSATVYDSTDESLVCSTPLPPLKNLNGAEPFSGPKTIKSMIAPTKGNKSSLASKLHSAPVGKQKSIKIEDDPPLAIAMKELNKLKAQSLVSMAFRVFNTRRQQIKENYHITFNESPDAIKFSKHSVDNINIVETYRYPPDEYLYPYEPSQRYLKGTPSLGLWNLKCLGFNLKGYSDSDNAECNIDRKSTAGACQLLGGKLVCWSAKTQQFVAMSSTEVEYVVATRCCANILWMKSQLIFCDNTSAIAISNNLVMQSRTKHIDIRYHFIRDYVLKGDIELHFIPTQYQLADIFTKPLDEPTFKRLIVKLGFDLKGYSDSDNAECNIDKKSIAGACQLLGGKLICWSAKTQQFVAMSSAEVDMYAIAISNNLVMQSRTKHIDIRYHFIRDYVLKGDIELHFIPTQYQLADIFTKPLDEPTFKRLIVKLGGKTGGLNQTSNKDATILYCLANRVHVDYAKLIWEDLIHKPNKKTKENIILYPRTSHTDHMKAIYNLDVHVDSKALKPSLKTEEGMDEGTKNDSFDHTFAWSNPSVLVDKTKSAGDRLKTAQTDSGANEESKADDISLKVKLEDLSNILKDTISAFFTSDSPPYEPIIVSYESEEEEEVPQGNDTEATSHDVPKDTSVLVPPSLKSAQLQELMA
nr:retrovirus-related Pol polyprotein from transposon TNT 1-94 [Tanacetum cinerariifolium]